MSNVKFPVLIWRDAQGMYTGSCLWGINASAADESHAGVMSQLKSVLGWVYRQNPNAPLPDFQSPRLVMVKHVARAAYCDERRMLIVQPSITVRVPCVFASTSDDLFVCSMPTLRCGLMATSAALVHELARENIAARLNNLTPLELSRHLPADEFKGDWVYVRIKRRTSFTAVPTLPSLSVVAEAIDSRRSRKRFSRAFMRNDEVSQVTTSLRQQVRNLLLVGEPGVGKTTVLVEAIRGIGSGAPSERGPRSAEQALYWLTSGSRLVAGMKYLGQWQRRCEDIIAELDSIGGVLCVESLMGLLRSGGSTPEDSVAAFLMPFMQRGELRVIAEATRHELDAAQRLLPGFVGLLEIFPIEPLDDHKSRRVLETIGESYRRNNRIDIQPEAIDSILRLHSRFMPHHSRPGRPIRFMQRIFEAAKRNALRKIGDTDISARFTSETGLPEALLRDDIALDPQELQKFFESRVLGQPSACRVAQNLVARFKAGVNDPLRPLGVLLFCGPTGVGKTELAKQLSNYLFGHGQQKDRLMRLDMSEYAGYQASERLITQPDGQPSQLLKRVRSQPFVVILLDEIEKASSDVFDTLLGLFDEGRLTDRFGRTTNFCSSVVIMTSNLGADAVKGMGFNETSQHSYERDVMSFFRPEFFNRIDEVVEFKPLDQDIIRKVTEKELREICQREGIASAGVELHWTEQVVDVLASEGFDARYGARPLQRTLERRIVAPLARWITENAGLTAPTLHIGVDENGEITIKAEAGAT